ncbi:Crp/Fnr family transcriptional regulator [Paenibacillus koleovorans]|uniref:Crp/Fnr family transcriptional regulator n=1 Tax=Paenibacillus koleovorans TaxID=121608 RepID=UPI000FDAB5B1|nr:Crp/Fnr family transcriptional regulator [Paenibacillus koleovorans]
MIEFLSQVPLFSKLNQDQLKIIAGISQKKGVRSGTILFREKEPGTIFYIVFMGAIKIFTANSSGEEKMLSLFKTGDSFGELSLIDGKPRSATAQAVEDTILISITAEAFMDLMKNNFEITLGIMQELSQRLRDTNQHVYDLTFLDARSRVIKNLIMLANKNGTRNGTQIVVRHPLNYDEISQMAGVQKNVLLQVMRDLTDRQIVSLGSTDFTLHLDRLRQSS